VHFILTICVTSKGTNCEKFKEKPLCGGSVSSKVINFDNFKQHIINVVCYYMRVVSTVFSVVVLKSNVFDNLYSSKM